MVGNLLSVKSIVFQPPCCSVRMCSVPVSRKSVQFMSNLLGGRRYRIRM